jgi:hypothetical protein
MHVLDRDEDAPGSRDACGLERALMRGSAGRQQPGEDSDDGARKGRIEA